MEQSNSEAGFNFEISSNGEQITFQRVEGVSTVIAAPASVKSGENPFKYRIPSLPKARNILLKNGNPKGASNLMQWCSTVKDKQSLIRTDKRTILLKLKDVKGNSLLEWTLYGAYPTRHLAFPATKSKPMEIEDLELAYSFYTLSKK
jgi:phage tail-like protein